LIVDTTLTASPVVTAVTSITSDYNGQDISCFGASDGSVTVVGGGGVPAFNYQWTDALNNPVSTNQSPSGLPSGLYNVVVTDQNGCTALATITLQDPPPFVYSVVVSTDYNGSDISCYGQSDGGIDLTVSGATPGYFFSWSNSTGSAFTIVEDPSGLAAGTYDVLTTDLNGCTFTTSITLTEPPLLLGVADITSDYNGQDVSCYLSTDGALTVLANGGTPTYSYQWTNSSGNIIGSGLNLSNIGEGIYQVQITDLNGCSFIAPIVVTQPTQLLTSPIIVSNYFGQAVSCEGETDGIVEAYVVGGTPNYSFSWNSNPVITTQTANNLGTGTYTVTVTDANGCVVSDDVTLTANPLPTFDLPPPISGCLGGNILLNSNAEAGSSCQWIFSDGQVFNNCGPFVANFANQDCYDLQLSVANAQGCISTASVTDYVCIQPNPLASFYADEYVLSNVGSGTNFWNTSQGADSYLWVFGDGSPTETGFNQYHIFADGDGFNANNYPVTLFAISDYGCIDSATVYITVNPELIFYVPNAFTPDGDAYNNTFFPVFSSGYDYRNYQFMIFNRWGELVFESDQVGAGWDGTYRGNKCQDGVYTWKIKVMNSVTDRKEEHVGHVTLLRGSGLK
jgi:gliding motility-associated-like protein